MIVAAALQIWSPTFSKAFDALPPGLRETVQRKIDEMGIGVCLSRSDAMTIAQPFMAGSSVNQMEKSQRDGRTALSSLTGLWKIADHESQP